MHVKKIVIVGGGFAGIKAALDLAHKHLPDTKITLISNKPHFEYHAALYRVLTGHSPLEVCIPLADIFKNKNVEVVKDTIIEVNIQEKTLKGNSESIYHYDELILALGSEPLYYDTPGLKELSFNIQSISETLRLKRHLHEIFLQCQTNAKEDKTCSSHIVIVGGGPTGCEVAGELAVYARQLAVKHGIDPSFVTIDLIQSGQQLLPNLPCDLSDVVKERLWSLGVNVLLNRRVMKEEVETVYLKDMEMKTKTLIWTAGVKPNSLYAQIGLPLDEKGRVIVNKFLQAKEGVYVVGDGAATEYAGLATTALHDGTFVAEHIMRKMKKMTLRPYRPVKQICIVPVGPKWAVAKWGSFEEIGFMGWFVRRLMDLDVFLTLLPFRKAFVAFQSDAKLTEACEVCGGTS